MSMPRDIHRNIYTRINSSVTQIRRAADTTCLHVCNDLLAAFVVPAEIKAYKCAIAMVY